MRMSPRLWIVGLIASGAIGALAGGHARAEPAPGSRLLVMPFAVSVDPASPASGSASFWLGEAAAILLTDEFQHLGVGAFTRDERVAAFDRLQLPMAATLTRATMIRVAELVGASEVVFGEVRLGDTVSVHARMVQLAAGRELPDAAETARLNDLFPLFQRLAGKLATGTGPPRGAQVAPAPALSLDGFENYVKGLVAATPAGQQRFLEAALKLAPRDGRVATALWGVYAAQGAHEKALAVASGVPADSAFSRKARFSAALSLIELGRFDGAVKTLSALETERQAPVLANALGVVELRRGPAAQPGRAAECFKRAVDAEPGNTEYLFNLGYAYARAHDAPNALSWLREAVRHDVVNGDAHLVMSAMLASSGKTVEAQRELDLAKLLGTKGDATGLTLGEKVPPGLERLPTDLDIAPTERVNLAQREQEATAAFHLDHGRRLLEQQNDRDAAGELRQAIYLSPYEDEPHLLLGEILQRGGRLTEAIDEFKIAIWCAETATAHVALGAALLQSGDKDAARREAQRALALAPGSESAKALLKRIGGE
jgi:tetratricopeptide (TPR) repeat protein